MPAHHGLAELLKYPLMSALAERRTRRIAQGVSLNAPELFIRQAAHAATWGE
jgi:hypothetical protein